MWVVKRQCWQAEPAAAKNIARPERSPVYPMIAGARRSHIFRIIYCYSGERCARARHSFFVVVVVVVVTPPSPRQREIFRISYITLARGKDKKNTLFRIVLSLPPPPPTCRDLIFPFIYFSFYFCTRCFAAETRPAALLPTKPCLTKKKYTREYII